MPIVPIKNSRKVETNQISVNRKMNIILFNVFKKKKKNEQTIHVIIRMTLTDVI